MYTMMSPSSYIFVFLCLQRVSVQWREHDAAIQPGRVFWPQPDKRGSRRRRGHLAASDQRPGEEPHPPAREHLPQPERSARSGVREMHDTGTGWLVREIRCSHTAHAQIQCVEGMIIWGCFLHSEPIVEEGDVEAEYTPCKDGKFMCFSLSRL